MGEGGGIYDRAFNKTIWLFERVFEIVVRFRLSKVLAGRGF